MQLVIYVDSALVIGQVTVDSYYDYDGDWVASLPGGTALNAAMWMDSNEFNVEIAATLGSDFPLLDNLNFNPSEHVEQSCPVSEIKLENNGREHVDHSKGDYTPQELAHADDYDLMYLTSGFSEYSEPFLKSNASLKGFSPGPEPENLDLDTVKEFLEHADHVIMNDRERAVMNERMNSRVADIPEEYDVGSVIVTSAENVVSYSSDGPIRLEVEKEDNPVDTIGAGDAFSSNYLISKYEGMNDEDAIKNGIEASKEIINQRGALPNQPVV